MVENNTPELRRLSVLRGETRTLAGVHKFFEGFI
jgi:hypothetical protein